MHRDRIPNGAEPLISHTFLIPRLPEPIVLPHRREKKFAAHRAIIFASE